MKKKGESVQVKPGMTIGGEIKKGNVKEVREVKEQKEEKEVKEQKGEKEVKEEENEKTVAENGKKKKESVLGAEEAVPGNFHLLTFLLLFI